MEQTVTRVRVEATVVDQGSEDDGEDVLSGIA